MCVLGTQVAVGSSCTTATHPLFSICCPEWIYPSMVLVNPLYIYTAVSQSSSDGIREARDSWETQNIQFVIENEFSGELWLLPVTGEKQRKSEGHVTVCGLSLVKLLGVLYTFYSYEFISWCKQQHFSIFRRKCEWYLPMQKSPPECLGDVSYSQGLGFSGWFLGHC